MKEGTTIGSDWRFIRTRLKNLLTKDFLSCFTTDRLNIAL